MASYLTTIASIFGTLSIATWLFAQAPQIIKNFRRRSTLGLSMYFIIYWFIGDVANLLGGLITGTTWTQIAQAIYFIVVDGILVCQWFMFHRRIWPWFCRYFSMPAIEEPTVDDVEEFKIAFRNSQEDLAAMGEAAVKAEEEEAVHHGVTFRTEEMCAIAPFAVAAISLSSLQAGEGTLGTLWGYLGAGLGYLSAVCYLASRAPQVWRNFRIRSVEGIAPMMFVMAVVGNGSYVLSIIFAAPYDDSSSAVGTFYVDQIPWILGSAGTFLFDFTIILQVVYFNILMPRLRRNKGNAPVPTDAIELKTPPDFTLNHTPADQSDPSVVIDSDTDLSLDDERDVNENEVEAEAGTDKAVSEAEAHSDSATNDVLPDTL
ncbi:PQ loop repeat [Carpediemonas membranifera]|uniref:PQ loop repeat n=1 Tax=Carpediemonas membranifera TaxID=201153 RepID=A0A8J6B881_9EUKA|nr:PQ loop repeat [Carpediemonas membranifera]|eukprot:KAG9392052.1 PQ loop repeat [Carpediemonas membranifera]